MLIGTYTNTLDPKGRVIIPAAFRCDLRERFILTKGVDECLYIYPLNEWESLVERLRTNLPSSKKGNRNAKKFFSANAIECEVDKQGRILIPQNLRKYASLDKDVLFVGDLIKVEVWNPDFYEEIEPEEVRNTLEELDIDF